MDLIRLRTSQVVEEHSTLGRSVTVRTHGRCRRVNAGISSENPDEKTGRRKSKVSWGRLIRPGLVDPKSRPFGVGDG